MRGLSSCLHKRWQPLLGMLIAAGVLVGWQLLPAGPAGTLFWPLWVAIAQVMFVDTLESTRLRRHAWLGQYIKRESPWHRLLGGGVFMALRVQLASILLALVLLVGLRLLDEGRLTFVGRQVACQAGFGAKNAPFIAA